MTPKKQYMAATLFGMLATGFAMAQMPGEGGRPGGSNTNFMVGEHGAQMMGEGMMRSEMLHGMVGTMSQMQDIMQKMAGTVGQGPLGANAKSMTDMSTQMQDMAGMMKNMATHLRGGKMDQAMLKDMNERLKTMGKALEPMQHTQKGVQGKEGVQSPGDRKGMEQSHQDMDAKAVVDMPKEMDDMATMMQDMAARMRNGKMDQAMFKSMNERMKSMEKSLAEMKNKKGPDTKGLPSKEGKH